MSSEHDSQKDECAMCALLVMPVPEGVHNFHVFMAYCLGRKVGAGCSQKEPLFCEEHDIVLTALGAMVDTLQKRFEAKQAASEASSR